MDGSPNRAFQVNELTPDPNVVFDPKVVKSYVTYAHRLAARGLVNSSVGGMVIRVAHPGYPDGVCYAKPQGISLEEVEAEDLVITDIPWGRILQGERATTVGHQMNREILRLRPDVNAVIHLHHDEMIAFMAAGYETIRSFSLTYGYLMQKPAHYLPAQPQRRGGCRADQELHPGHQLHHHEAPRLHRAGPQRLGGLSPDLRAGERDQAQHHRRAAVRGQRQDAGIHLRGGAGLHGHARRRRDVSQAGQEGGVSHWTAGGRVGRTASHFSL